MTAIVSARGVTKEYRVYRRPADRLLELVSSRWRPELITALDDVSFSIERGETIGLVGRNGAGKSTLLKILAGVVASTRGEVAIDGRIASILELGVGFHPEFSGRANAEIAASILGVGRDEMKLTLPRILEFTELDAFLEQPVRTWSSGMIMRLGFSVAVHVDPDLLLVDEALAVGDLHFQRKCLEKMREFEDRGRTVIFCSHSLGAVASTCVRTLWLDRGRLAMFGPTAGVIRAYEAELLATEAEPVGVGDTLPERPSRVRLRAASVTDAEGGARSEFEPGEPLAIALRLEAESEDEQIHMVVGIDRALDGVNCFSFGTHWDGMSPLSGRRAYEVSLLVPDVPLNPGEYRVFAFVGDGEALHLHDRAELSFSIGGEGDPGTMFEVGHEWRIRRLGS
ncbi:MAG: ABC transporter ATP-binding protein [Thermoanaerobaculia bacterium]